MDGAPLGLIDEGSPLISSCVSELSETLSVAAVATGKATVTKGRIETRNQAWPESKSL